ncbi:serpin family protein [Haloechinothrix sp. LS1_15]|uniref:serpin family protein n=1 Tax=Haloechinothrix sp. LS1_15 TaxID=2652248 RepID=UPI002947C86D|nr:serpin family protein [Haloechinothrix sp. LS1_15]MDV6012250.1 serpin family protein [Haloechinothrix sp. LS1_15]
MTTPRTLSMLLTLMLIMATGACATGGPDDDTNPTGGGGQLVSDADRLSPAEDAPVEAAVAGLRSFTGDYTEALASRQDTEAQPNTVYSPISLGYAFAMLRAGATGDTAAQLDDVFGFPEGVHEAYNALSAEILNTGEPPPREQVGATRDPDEPPEDPIVSIANGLFVQQGFEVGEPFLRALAQHYGAGARAVDFPSGEAVDIINRWVSEHTEERIEQLFEELDPETVTVLANAIYLKADWQAPFEEHRTEHEPFQLPDGDTTEVPMMHREAAELGYATGDGWHAARLPYVGRELVMWVVVPTDRAVTAPPITGELLSELAEAGTTMVELAMPRWDFASDVEVLPLLAELGVTDLAGLDGIGEAVEVSDAIHRATITVDENGTEAAAVTGIAGAVSAPPPSEVSVRADRPFSFALTHEPTGAPLFVGSVTDPTEED